MKESTGIREVRFVSPDSTYLNQLLAGAMFGAGLSTLDSYVRHEVHAFKPTWRGALTSLLRHLGFD
jgi:hypothetical protein